MWKTLNQLLLLGTLLSIFYILIPANAEDPKLTKEEADKIGLPLDLSRFKPVDVSEEDLQTIIEQEKIQKRDRKIIIGFVVLILLVLATFIPYKAIWHFMTLKSVKAFLSGTAIWAIIVFMYVSIFEPFGYFDDKDMAKTLMIILGVPIIIVLGRVWYKAFVKNEKTH
ncbi:MAG: hypothetical protein AB2594_19085 [Candidatus Thiodiazotropha sp.]